MKITTAQQKALLSGLFYEKTGQITSEGRPVYQAIQFPFSKLMDAASAAKKLTEGSETEGEITRFKDGPIELTHDEASVVSDLFDKNKDNWGITEADTVMELQALFHGD